MPTPIRDLGQRLPEAGRIRMGVKGGTQGRRSIETFRFTSHDEKALIKLAELYGGTPQPWNDSRAAPGQHELITTSAEINIALPPDPLSVAYELWSGGGNKRRCDGELCDLATGEERQEVDCICAARGVMECKLKVRLSVLIPEVRFLGTWRLDTSSIHAALEMPGIVAAIQQLGGSGIVRAVLINEGRTQVKRGRTSKFRVPVIGFDHSLDELAAGTQQIGRLPAPTTPPPAELGAPDRPVSEHWTVDVVEAEVVDEEPRTTWDKVSGEHEVNVGLARMFVDHLTGAQKAQALIRARELALELGEPIPTTADSISPVVIDKLMTEWGVG